MTRNRAMLLSGAVTAFVLMLVIGLVYGANRFSAQAADAASAPSFAASARVGSSAPTLAGGSDAASVAQLQDQVRTLKTELEQAYSDLQTAYNQIAGLQSQAASGRSGGRFRGGDDNRGVSPFGSTQSLPFMQEFDND